MAEFQKVPRIPLVILGLVAGGFLLVSMKTILMPLVVAFFLMNLVGPSLNFLRRKGAPLGLAILVSVGVTAAMVFFLGDLFYRQVPQLLQEYPNLSTKLAENLDHFNEALPPALRGNWRNILPGAETVAHWLGSLLGVVGTLFLILLYMIFLLMEREQIFFRIRKAYGEKDGARIVGVFENIARQTEAYVVGKSFISLATGLLFALVLWLFGVKYFLVLGMLAFLLNFIPNIGSWIATLIPLLVALAQMAHQKTLEGPVEGFTWQGIGGLAVCLILIQVAVGSFAEPKILGSRLDLSPFMVFFSFVVWGWLWGLPGMILAVPIMATLKIVCENVDPLKPVAVLLSNRKAAGPAARKSK